MVIGGWKLKYKKRRKKKPRGSKYQAYTRRNDRLSGLGYASYAEYLKSEDWKKIREAKLRKFPGCLLCGRKAEQVHHLDYANEVLLGLVPQLLVTLCDGCHEAIEFSPGGEKRAMGEANVELRRLAHELGLQRWLMSIKRARELMLIRRKGARTKRQAYERGLRTTWAEYRRLAKEAKAKGLAPPPKPPDVPKKRKK